ncbi:AGAP002080-PA-like protein [Anopheles sinensis]|uniref:AGAP002080-PA-like protein n=1 Tax=Anopheles sinensis TaxID=74873 RepID=A0A084VAG1_ANOSI|nr:AGAP002080-PA-like protein [Anopheles sinensis]
MKTNFRFIKTNRAMFQVGFCPSVFLYLSSIVPAIWLLELDKLDKRTRYQDQMLNETINLAATVGKDLKDLNKMLGVKIQLPDIQLTAEMWVTLIEQFLMLVLIIGRWMLPKGDLTRDQLSQLLLVYIGTAADIIEFFDSFKDAKIANEPVLVLLTLSIWSWSLLQFTIVLSATRARKPRGGGSGARSSAQDAADDASCCNVACCNIDVWGIALNILLQDAPFLTFRLLIIVHYKIITYMNIFFTCEYRKRRAISHRPVSPDKQSIFLQLAPIFQGKNTLVILLQLYRLYVVNSENRKAAATKQRLKARGKVEQSTVGARHQKQRKISRRKVADIVDDDLEEGKKSNSKHSRKHRSSSSRKDTGYSTASSQTTAEQRRLRKTARPRAGDESDGGDDPCPVPPSPPPPPPPASGGDTDTEKPVERRPKESKDRKSARHSDGKSGGSGRKKQPPPPIDSDRSDDEIEAKARHKQRKRTRNGTSETAGFEIIHEKSATGSRKKKPKPPKAEPSETGSSSSGTSTQSSASSTGSSSGTE